MNKRIVLPVILVPFIVIGLVFTVGCGEPKPTQYVPRYSADQVVVVVKAQYPTSFKTEYVGGDRRTVDAPTQISVQFVGGTNHAWKATITCPPSYYIVGRVNSLVVYFWETDGSLHGSLQ